MEKKLNEAITKATEMIEEELDQELKQLNKLNLNDIDAIRDSRRVAFKKQLARRAKWDALGHGIYTELPDEKAIFKAAKESDRAVLHFYRDDEYECKIVDANLRVMATRHPEARIVKVNQAKCPYLSAKWDIKNVPCVFALINNVKVGRFEGVAATFGTVDITIEQMEDVLDKMGVIEVDKTFRREDAGDKKKSTISFIKKKTIRGPVDDSDSDSD